MLTNYFEDTEILNKNTLPRRSYFIPYASETETQGQNRQNSSNFMLLNGEWDFKYFDNVRLISEEYWLPEHQDKIEYEKMEVPSAWQLNGHGQIQYTNVEYPIPFNPPYVPYDNPAGLYHRTFEMNTKDLTEDVHLNFEGVNSAFYVWVNDEFIGYGSISHSNNEFDITDALVDGENHLNVLVVQYSSGTYFEDQDMFRYSGIIRDVYLLKRKKERINHFKLTHELSNDLSEAKLLLELEETQNLENFHYTVYNPSGKVIAEGEEKVEKGVEIKISNPLLWNAETPYLYKVLIEAGGEVIPQEVGLRSVEIKGTEFFLNNQPIKFIGVNHHDTNPNTGPTVTVDQQLNDLKKMKELNFNAVRTAHYPKTGEFYELCDRLGFYVISEADIECHGVVELMGKGGYDNYNMMINDPTYAKNFIERMEASMILYLNYSSIIMWSGGNESGYGLNFEKTGKRAREIDPRPLHYEGWWHRDRSRENDDQYVDVYSRMYTGYDEMEELYLNEEHPIDRPFLLCEYVHAMGNGPGDIQEYYDRLMHRKEYLGGFVWEWADHAINLNRGTDQTPKYRYGGDFGEYPHSGNFCMDGLMYPDRTFHTGSYEHRQVFRRVKLVEEDLTNLQYTFKNLYDFMSLEGNVAIRLEVFDLQGEVIYEERFNSIQAAPKECLTLSLDLKNIEWNEMSSLRFVYERIGEHNYDIGFDQVSVHELTVDPIGENKNSSIQLKETLGEIEVTVGNKAIYFNKGNGALNNIISDKQSLLAKPSKWNIWRAPTDNDRKIKDEWLQSNYHLAQTRITSKKILEEKDQVILTFKGMINAVSRQNIMEVKIIWTVSSNGEIELKINGDINEEFPFLPRFGLYLPMVKNYDTAEYIGNGPYESYQDKINANYLGKFKQTVDDLYEPYIKPQENGSHNNIHSLKIFADNQPTLQVIPTDELSFNLSKYSVEQLTEKMHRDVLSEEDATFLSLDYKQSGIGSNSCGPELLEKYQLKGTFDWSFKLIVSG